MTLWHFSANPNSVQKHHLIQDVGVYVLKHIHSILVSGNIEFSEHDLEDNFATAITRSDQFKFTPLDIWRIRSEIYIFIRRVAVLYKSHRVIDNSHGNMLNPPPGNHVNDVKVPTLLRYSFMTEMIDVGDVIEYKFRTDMAIGTLTPDSFVRRATVVDIVEVENHLSADSSSKSGTTLTLHLNNGERVINALHLVRRISMQCIHSNRPLWNPVRHWVELSSIYMNPSKVLEPPAIVVDKDLADSQVTHPTEATQNTECDQAGVPNQESDIIPEHTEGQCPSKDGPEIPSPDDADECNVDPAPEMRDPDLIPLYGLPRTNTQRKHHIQQLQTEAKQLDSNESGYIGSYLHWLTGDRLHTEMHYLNGLYRTCMSFGDSASFYKLLSFRTAKDYKKAKTAVDRKMKERVTKYSWSVLKILLPICFFSKFLQPNDGPEATVIIDENPHHIETLREQKRTEGALEFEYKNSQLKIRACMGCRENHLVEVKMEILPTDTYTCSKCSKLEENAYIDLRLQPIWYERVEGAKSHADYKLDQSGQKIVKYGIPKVLLSLTVAEQLLIRRCAPFIPSFHIGKGFYGLKGHCVAFAQDITTMAKVLPHHPESVVTFIRAMGNKDTTELKLQHLKVSRDRVVKALQWLKIHHEGYRNIRIDTEQLAWMKGKDTAIIKGTHRKLVFDDKENPRSKDFVSKVQCAGDHMHEGELDYSIFGMSNGDTVPNGKSEDINQLVNASQKAGHGKDKLMLFPPHGDKPVR